MVYHAVQERSVIYMGMFVNPDNSAFQVALNSEIYVDKSGLIDIQIKYWERSRNMFVSADQDDLESLWRQIC